ncbi:MAG: TrmH family RNA methyltransferase [Sphingorhabdus sp.]
MSFWTYMVKCADGSYYTGHTDDLEKRIGEHHGGVFETCYTFSRRPLEVVWADNFQTREEALIVERQIKGWSRAKKESLIRGDWEAVQRLAKKNFDKSEQSNTLRYGTSHTLSTYSGRTDETETASSIPFVLSRVPSASEVPVSKEMHISPPIIILVRPQLGENIGKAARAMLNFGLTELRLVAPRDGWPNPDAGPAGAGADVVLEKAQVYDTLAEAVADIAHIYATTVRKRGVTKPVLTPEAAASEIISAQGRSAILFGAERSGLETDDVAVARSIITVPINPEFGSLNLAQAVILCAYEWSKHQHLESPPKIELDPPAPQIELDGMIDQLFAMLEQRNFFFPPARTTATKRTLRNLLTKPGWNSLEVRTLRGVFRAFRKRDA